MHGCRFMKNSIWPDLQHASWIETRRALHLWLQIVGKYSLSHSPWVNHSWNSTLRVTTRGIKTQMTDDAGGTEVELDLIEGALRITSAAGHVAQFPLGAMSIAEFLTRFEATVAYAGGSLGKAQLAPNELEQAVPFREDTARRSFSASAARQFHLVLLRVSRVFDVYRSAFLGKSSPVHLFWGSFDLAVTRFSGRRAPCHSGGIPHLSDKVVQEAYSHELHSVGFWPGDERFQEPAFYAYAYPEPAGFAAIGGLPDGARYEKDLGEFVLPYSVVRECPDPDATLLNFMDATYGAAADLGGWDRALLDCPRGQPLRPREPGCIQRPGT